MGPADERPPVRAAKLKPTDILFIREVFNLSQRELAKALNVTPATAARWELADDGHKPTGLHDDVLRALHLTAAEVHADEIRRVRIAGMIRLGIGALIFYLLQREAEPANSSRL